MRDLGAELCGEGGHGEVHQGLPLQTLHVSKCIKKGRVCRCERPL